MIISVCFFLVLISVPLSGGRLSRIGELRIAMGWTIALALAIQIVVISVLEEAISPELGAALHLLSYGLGLVFIWSNRGLVGMPVIVLGGMLNLIAIAANGGVMPASAKALETAGIARDTGTFENSVPLDGARFWFLGDIFAVPDGVPFANVFSIGDVVLVVGAAIFLHSTAGSRLARGHRQPVRANS